MNIYNKCKWAKDSNEKENIVKSAQKHQNKLHDVYKRYTLNRHKQAGNRGRKWYTMQLVRMKVYVAIIISKKKLFKAKLPEILKVIS